MVPHTGVNKVVNQNANLDTRGICGSTLGSRSSFKPNAQFNLKPNAGWWTTSKQTGVVCVDSTIWPWGFVNKWPWRPRPLFTILGLCEAWYYRIAFVKVEQDTLHALTWRNRYIIAAICHVIGDVWGNMRLLVWVCPRTIAPDLRAAKTTTVSPYNSWVGDIVEYAIIALAPISCPTRENGIA